MAGLDRVYNSSPTARSHKMFRWLCEEDSRIEWIHWMTCLPGRPYGTLRGLAGSTDEHDPPSIPKLSVTLDLQHALSMGASDPPLRLARSTPDALSAAMVCVIQNVTTSNRLRVLGRGKPTIVLVEWCDQRDHPKHMVQSTARLTHIHTAPIGPMGYLRPEGRMVDVRWWPAPARLAPRPMVAE